MSTDGACRNRWWIGVGSGSALMGVTYDHAHSYQPMLIAFAAMMAVACLLLLRLGPYAYPRKGNGEVTLAAEPTIGTIDAGEPLPP